MSSGIGERDSENQTSDFRNLVGAYKAEKEKKKGNQSLDRLQDAFQQLKGMHKDPALEGSLATEASLRAPSSMDGAQWPFGPMRAPSQPMAAASAPSPLDGAHWPFGPVGAPSQAQASAPPAEAPQAPQDSPFAGMFARNAAMMKDPVSGEFIDPSAALSAGPGILSSLFG